MDRWFSLHTRAKQYPQNSEHCSLFCILLLACLTLSACSRSADPAPLVLQGPTMGTYYRVTVHDHPAAGHENLKQRIEAELDAVNLAMSTYLSDSELSRINRLPAGQTVQISEPLAEVLGAALKIAHLSEGLFDPTVGPLVRLWGFGPDGRIESVPTPEAIRDQLARVGYQRLTLDGLSLTKQHTDLELDLSAIAKGFAIDQVAGLLSELGLQHWLVDVGGELRASGLAGKRPWQVAIETPSAGGGIEQVTTLVNSAIATSGDYRNVIQLGNKIVSHAINPITGYPIEDALASATVRHETAMLADAYATAMLVMGEERALEFAQESGLDSYLISRQTGGGFHIRVTGDFVSSVGDD